MINDIKPFYVYTENNCLYIKNINEKINKIANNIVSYCANFDDNNFIHICSIDTKGRLIHFLYKNGRIKRKILCKACHNINNLKNMRLFIIEKYLIKQKMIQTNEQPFNYPKQKRYKNK